MVSSCGFSGFVASPHCEIGFPKALFGVVSSFLRRCLFHVVSLSRRFETAPGLSASKYIKFIVCRV